MLARLRLQDEEKQSSDAEDGNERCLLGPRHVGNVLCKVHITDSKSEHYALREVQHDVLFIGSSGYHLHEIDAPRYWCAGA